MLTERSASPASIGIAATTSNVIGQRGRLFARITVSEVSERLVGEGVPGVLASWLIIRSIE